VYRILSVDAVLELIRAQTAVPLGTPTGFQFELEVQLCCVVLVVPLPPMKVDTDCARVAPGWNASAAVAITSVSTKREK
jgi:hypothetical protein